MSDQHVPRPRSYWRHALPVLAILSILSPAQGAIDLYALKMKVAIGDAKMKLETHLQKGQDDGLWSYSVVDGIPYVNGVPVLVSDFGLRPTDTTITTGSAGLLGGLVAVVLSTSLLEASPDNVITQAKFITAMLHELIHAKHIQHIALTCEASPPTCVEITNFLICVASLQDDEGNPKYPENPCLEFYAYSTASAALCAAACEVEDPKAREVLIDAADKQAQACFDAQIDCGQAKGECGDFDTYPPDFTETCPAPCSCEN